MLLQIRIICVHIPELGFILRPPGRTTPSYAAKLHFVTTLQAVQARVTMTQPELSLPNYQPLLKYLSWTGTQLKKEEKRLKHISIKYIPGSIKIGAKDLYIPCLSVLRMEQARI